MADTQARVPAAIRGWYAALGRAQAGLARRWQGKSWSTLLVLICACVFGVLVLDRLFPPPLHRAERAGVMVTSVEGVPLRAFPTPEGRWRFPVSLDGLDPQFVKALVAVEDKRFWSHPGVDALAVARAVQSLLRSGEVVSGASTITMQAARLLEPRPRTLGSKVIEVVRALQIEARLSKTEILELYLTLTPYGGNLESVRAASLSYFSKEPEHLAPEQIALLLALPQAPEARRPDRRPIAAKASRDLILDRMATLGLIDPGQATEAKDLPVPARQLMPQVAWQAADRVLAVSSEEMAGSDRSAGVSLRSSISFSLQRRAEDRVRDFVGAANRVEPGGTLQGAAVIIETQTMAVRALVGSAGRERPGGWLDLTERPRSPGSTLKPFVYAFAFEDGLAGPQTRIIDLPQRFGAGYQPENFDRGFAGDVTVAEALQHSLNIPAVLTLDRIGASRFSNQLAFAGVTPLLPTGAETSSGLALALGGVGMKMTDLALLYGALANEGSVIPLCWLAVECEARTEGNRTEKAHVGSSADRRLFSAETADAVVQILRGTPAPTGRMPGRLTADAPEIAFKTGTSYGFRDAWAAGLSQDHLVIVWIGRVDGGARAGQTGRSDALPLLFSLFDDVSASQVGGKRYARDTMTEQAGRGRFKGRAEGPQVMFPPAKATLYSESFGETADGFVLSGQGREPLNWFVDGRPVARDAGGLPVWRPTGPGFYTVSVVDELGRQTDVTTRVLGFETGGPMASGTPQPAR